MAFTSRRIEMAQQVLKQAIAYMATKKEAATAQPEVAFYETQTVEFQALVDLMGAAAPTGDARTIRLTENQFRILSGCVKNRNLQEAVAINALPAGAERDQRHAAYSEWSAFHDAIDATDPRKYDTSQDAEEEEIEEDPEESPDSAA